MKTYLGLALGLTALTLTAGNALKAADNVIVSGKGAEEAAHSHAAKPARNPAMDWQLRVDETLRSRPAFLAFEQADTDNQPLSFSCEEGGMRIFVGMLSPMSTVSSITLTAGDVTLDVKGKNERSELGDLYYFQSAEIAADDSFFDAFAQNGWLAYAYYRASTDLVGSASGEKAVKDFVAHCRNV